MAAALDSSTPINDLVHGLHGPVDSVAEVMNRLVPFPQDVGTLADANLLDVSVSVDAPGVSNPTSAISAKARYGTLARVVDIVDFYCHEICRSSRGDSHPIVSRNVEGRSVVETVLVGCSTMAFRVVIADFGSYRSVSTTAEYCGVDHLPFFERFAGWHGGMVPVDNDWARTGVEIATFGSCSGHQLVALYSTRYEHEQRTEAQARSMIRRHLGWRGWSHIEPRTGIMFLRDTPFDAEIHIHGEDGVRSSGASVSFVGEFQLR